VWFELGYFWARHDSELDSLDEAKKVYYPIVVNGVNLPNPVYDLQIQAAFIDDNNGIYSFFRRLTKQFKGTTTRLDTQSIVDLAQALHTIDTSKKEEIADSASPFDGYSDDALLYILDDNYLSKQFVEFRKAIAALLQQLLNDNPKGYPYAEWTYDALQDGHPLAFIDALSHLLMGYDQPPDSIVDYFRRRDNLFTGKMIYFSLIDEELRLPRGTTQRLLKPILRADYQLIPDPKYDFGDDCARFKIVSSYEIQQLEDNDDLS
jgi:hypothetical protein